MTLVPAKVGTQFAYSLWSFAKCASSRSMNGRWPARILRRATSGANHSARSTSGNDCRRPLFGGHSISNVFDCSQARRRHRPRPRTRAPPCGPAAPPRRDRRTRRRSPHPPPPRIRASPPPAHPRRRRTRPSESTRRRRPCAPRTGRPDARAAARAHRRRRRYISSPALRFGTLITPTALSCRTSVQRAIAGIISSNTGTFFSAAGSCNAGRATTRKPDSPLRGYAP